MRILTTAMLPFLLIACGKSVREDNVAFGPEASDGLQAGNWTLSATLGTPQNANPGREPPLTVQQVSGNYGRTSFHITIDMPFHGLVVRQTIEARRIGDC